MSTQKDKPYEVRVPLIHTCSGNPIHSWGDGSFDESILDDPVKNRALVSSMLKDILGEMPEYLYNFQKYDRLRIDSFQKQEVWFANPLTFNDPFDPLPYFDTKKINKASKRGAFRKIREWFSELFIREKKEDRSQDNTRFVHKTLNQYTRIFSMASRWNVPLLWGHYADGHRGFAVGYSREKIKELLYSEAAKLGETGKKPTPLFVAVPVVYDRLAIEKGFFDATDVIANIRKKNGDDPQHPTMEYKDFISMLQCYLYKSFDWYYESEWRLIRFCPDPEQKVEGTAVPLQPDVLYLGVRMPDKHKLEICKIAHYINSRRKSGQAIKVYRIEGRLHNKEKRARLRAVPIDPARSVTQEKIVDF